MAEQRQPVPRETPDPLVLALAAVVREIHAKRVEDRAQRRATMTTVDGGKRGGRSA